MRIDKTVDFSFIYEVLANRYSTDRGRPSEEPVFLFKICLLEYLYNLSDVKVVQQIPLNLVSIEYPHVPDDTTLSYFRIKQVGLKKFEEIFHRLLHQCIEEGLIPPKQRAIMDSTHIIADVEIPTWLSLV